MPMRPGVIVLRTTDGYIKLGDGPFQKWVVETVDGVKVYTLLVKDAAGDTPKEVLRA